jgi:hypothetical protein
VPYREPPRPPEDLDGRFAFRSARVRIGRDRFELSMWDSAWIGMAIGVVPFAPFLLAVLTTLASAAIIGSLLFLLSVAPRRALVVTRRDAWIEERFAGLTWRRARLGRRPDVETGIGWDWNEIAVIPSDPVLRIGLHDGERVVFAEWGLNDSRKDDDARRLAAFANAEIARLHARP